MTVIKIIIIWSGWFSPKLSLSSQNICHQNLKKLVNTIFTKSIIIWWIWLSPCHTPALLLISSQGYNQFLRAQPPSKGYFYNFIFLFLNLYSKFKSHRRGHLQTDQLLFFSLTFVLLGVRKRPLAFGSLPTPSTFNSLSDLQLARQNFCLVDILILLALINNIALKCSSHSSNDWPYKMLNLIVASHLGLPNPVKETCTFAYGSHPSIHPFTSSG